MELKRGLFSATVDDVVRGMSPSRTRSVTPRSDLMNGRKGSGSLRETLAPLMEGPESDGGEIKELKRSGLKNWIKGKLLSSTHSIDFKECSDLRLLLGVMGAPLAPVYVCSAEPLPHLSIKSTPIETSSAHYILQQYTAACGGQKHLNNIKNSYVMGKIKMIASEFETAAKVVKNKNEPRDAETGGFVLWQMNPDMWYVELVVGGSKAHAGCSGKLMWRHTPWLGSRAAKGPARPLRRALQGLDPRTTTSIFSNAKCIGEKKINGEDRFILKLCADPQMLKARSEFPAEIIRHILFGYFSQKTGLLVCMEDSNLIQIQSNGGEAGYWETMISSYLDDYKLVEGITIAHSGRSAVSLFRFGDTAMSHLKTRMEEAWTIGEVAFNVPGLSLDCFIPPTDLRSSSLDASCEVSLDGG